MIKSFKPVVDGNTKIMIIGSMPGAASLKAGQYYAYKYNQFWPLMTALLSPSAPPVIYAQKLQMLLDNNIGLWDSLAACRRDGSLDGNIKEEQPNDFKRLLEDKGALVGGSLSVPYKRNLPQRPVDEIIRWAEENKFEE
jgi:hypoxanthine-DNA glycosylase